MLKFGQGGQQAIPDFGDMTVGDYANGIPSIRINEMFRAFIRQLRWMIPLLAIGAAVAFFLTKDMKRDYEAQASVMVQPAETTILVPGIGAQPSQGISQTIDTLTLNEAAIMKNSDILKGLYALVLSPGSADNPMGQYRNSFAPSLEKTFEVSDEGKDKLYKFIDKNYVVAPRAKSGVIDLTFKHENPDIAKDSVNTLLDLYLDKRKTIYNEDKLDELIVRQSDAEGQLKEVEDNIQKFLRNNNISDFRSERTGATNRTENLRAQLNTVKSQLAESEAALATVETQLRETNKEIITRKTDLGEQRIAQAELELQQLLAKYLPGSDPVKVKKAEIAELKSLQNARGGASIGGIQRGPNPSYQALLTRRNTLQSTADSYREKEFAVQAQLKSADAKVRKLQNLSPQLNALLRKQETLDLRLKDLNSKVQEARINQDQKKSENVIPINRADMARKGRNKGKILAALIILGWGFTLFMAALLRVFLDPKLYMDPNNRMRPKQSDPTPNENTTHSQRNHIDVSTYIPEPVPTPATAYQPHNAHTSVTAQSYAPQPIKAVPYVPHAPYAPATAVATGNLAYDYSSEINPYTEANEAKTAQFENPLNHMDKPANIPGSETE